MSNANVSSGRFVNCDSNLRQVQFRNGVSAIIGEWGDAAQISRSHKGRQAVIKRRDFYARRRRRRTRRTTHCVSRKGEEECPQQHCESDFSFPHEREGDCNLGA